MEISGRLVEISGKLVEISGQVVDINGQIVEISGQLTALDRLIRRHAVADQGVHKPNVRACVAAARACVAAATGAQAVAARARRLLEHAIYGRGEGRGRFVRQGFELSPTIHRRFTQRVNPHGMLLDLAAPRPARHGRPRSQRTSQPQAGLVVQVDHGKRAWGARLWRSGGTTHQLSKLSLSHALEDLDFGISNSPDVCM